MTKYKMKGILFRDSGNAVRSYSYSKALTAGVITVALTGVWGTSFAKADDNGINRLAVRNCTEAKMLVCAYDKTDNILAIPYHARRIKPRQKERLSCGSANRCKLFMGTDVGGMKKVLSSKTNSNIVYGVGGAAGSIALTYGVGGTATMAVIGAAGVGLAGALGIAAAGGVVATSAALGTVLAVVKTIDGVEAGKMCKTMMREQRKVISKIDDKKLRNQARDSFKRKLKGRFPKYKNYSIVVQKNGLLQVVSGDKCS